jgi:hypothetical protein
LNTAIPEFALLHVTVAVRSRVLPSLYVPVAIMACVVPNANDGFAGVTAIDTSTGCPTLSAAVPTIDPQLALTVVVPTPVPVANPVPATLATPLADELQLTPPVTFCVLPSLYVPVAVNCSVVPFAIVALAGVTDSDTKTAGVTVRMAEPLTEPDLAAMLAAPGPTQVANPELLFTVATALAEDAHLAVLVRFCVVPLL